PARRFRRADSLCTLRRRSLMRRTVIAASSAAATLLAILGLWWASPTTAKDPAPVPPDQGNAQLKPPTASLPIGHAVLFSSGVGYFQREGEVEGNSRVDLSFPGTDVNDLLKSLVLQDAGGGKVSTISYDSPDPIEKTLKSFALDLT